MSKVNITITDDMVDRANRTYMARCDRSLSHATIKAILDAAINGEAPPEPREPEIPVTKEMLKAGNSARKSALAEWFVSAQESFDHDLELIYRAMRKLEPATAIPLVYVGGPHAANEASLTDDIVENLISGESIYADALPMMVNRLIKTLDVWRAAARLAERSRYKKFEPQMMFEGFDNGKMIFSIRAMPVNPAEGPQAHEAR